ncbi:MAG: hypothetical protein Q3M30_10805 [Candidatus Electrothrix sp. Rat3]|nr:hypothetical protein [Candidatus Electrothrix rattekaaiensis]
MPLETNAPLTVHSDGVLPFSVTMQGMESVAGVEHQGFKTRCGMKNHKSFSCLPFKGLKTADTTVVEQFFRISATEAIQISLVGIGVPFFLRLHSTEL